MKIGLHEPLFKGNEKNTYLIVLKQLVSTEIFKFI